MISPAIRVGYSAARQLRKDSAYRSPTAETNHNPVGVLVLAMKRKRCFGSHRRLSSRLYEPHRTRRQDFSPRAPGTSSRHAGRTPTAAPDCTIAELAHI